MTAAEVFVKFMVALAFAFLVLWMAACSTTPKCPLDCFCNQDGQIEYCGYMKDLVDEKPLVTETISVTEISVPPPKVKPAPKKYFEKAKKKKVVK